MSLPTIGRASAARTLRSPGELTFVAVFYLMVTTALASLWRATAGAIGGTFGGYSAAELVWYVAATEAITIAVPLRLIDDIGVQIADGRWTDRLLRPIDPLAAGLAEHVGQVLPRLAVCVGLGGVFATIMSGRAPGLVGAGLTVVALVGALAASLTQSYVVAAVAYFWRDTRAAWILYQKVIFVAGGMLLPLEVLPDAVQPVAKALPFAAVAYIPGRFAAGRLDPVWLLVQWGWIVAAGAVAVAVHRRGERRLVEGLT